MDDRLDVDVKRLLVVEFDRKIELPEGNGALEIGIGRRFVFPVPRRVVELKPTSTRLLLAGMGNGGKLEGSANVLPVPVTSCAFDGNDCRRASTMPLVQLMPAMVVSPRKQRFEK